MAKSKDADGNRAAMEGEDVGLVDQRGASKDDQPKDYSLPDAIANQATPAPMAAMNVVEHHPVSKPNPQMAAGSRYVLPKWRSHGDVYAAPIHSFDDQSIYVDGGDNPNVMQLVMVKRPDGIFDRGEPATGDYLLLYPGGGVAWMPKKAFEAMHDRVPDNEI